MLNKLEEVCFSLSSVQLNNIVKEQQDSSENKNAGSRTGAYDSIIIKVAAIQRHQEGDEGKAVEPLKVRFLHDFII
ncbi:hypothetical protein ACFSRY_18985 [Pontibacter locisalis]|uniref:Uncharacterized protein n=1 Tax=Pontibacter locisalis TaxID=1719035 RepID=A0ABW5ITE6_9BACT